MNVDLCFVPAMHQAQVKLPAVSGSSGKLVVQHPKVDVAEAEYPGMVFANLDLDYAQAMTEFVSASAKEPESLPKHGAETESESLGFEKQKLGHEEEKLRAQRRGVRERRQQEDAAWQALKAKRRAQQQKRKVLRRANKRPPWGSQTAENQHFKQLRQQRHAQVEQRTVEDKQWRTEREQLRLRLSQLPLVMAWIAILVITDNCTRQCLGLPIFVAGANVTAEMVVSALRRLLPAELQFLVSDRGPQFRANLMKQLALDLDFIHVVIARHRPQSNGIAERFVPTLKEWLADKFWQSDQELTVLLNQFQPEYNDRPHQGLPISGLSHNEFANRIGQL